MFTNMENTTHSNRQTRSHLSTRHVCSIRGHLTSNFANANAPDKVYVVSERNVQKQPESKRPPMPKSDAFMPHDTHKARFARLSQQRQQLEQQILKSVTRSAIRGEGQNVEKTRKLPSAKISLNFNLKGVENAKYSKVDVSTKSAKNAPIDSSKILSTVEAHCVASMKNIHISSENRSICVQTDRSETVELDAEAAECAELIKILKKPSLEIPLKEYCEKEMYFVIQQRVEEAVKNKKIFLIRADIPYLEKILKKRGWIQKYESRKTRHIPYGSVVNLETSSLGDIYLPNGTLNERLIIFNALKHVPPDFIWDCRNDFVEWTGHMKPTTLLNRFEKSYIYTSKLGMATILENVHWFSEDDVASVQCPRSYNVARDKTAFIEDYRRTAAVGLLKWFVEQMQKGADIAYKGSSPISTRQIEFAIKRCEELVAMKNDDYLDMPETTVSLTEWDKFIDDYTNAVHHGNGIMDLGETNLFGVERASLSELHTMAEEVLRKVKDFDPEYDLNGMRNIWILKPSNFCCGAGIMMTHKLNYIIRKVHETTRDHFVVQKYIEKPLLVKETKFDVRQWYLVTKSTPLTIWIYKESFLRFSSRPFTFDNYHEAIHICNTAVQNRYAVSKNSIRSEFWDCEKLNEYLTMTGYEGNPWYEEIYPKICQAIVATMLAAQEHMDKRKCSFELYGADFMIMDDLSVWLIEINTNPRMHPPSTRITQRLYPDVLDSLIKVIMDYPSNPSADTGNFTLLYQQENTDFQPRIGTYMLALGKAFVSKSRTTFD